MKDLKEESEISKRISLAEEHEKRDTINKVKKKYSHTNKVFPFWIYPLAGLATLLILGGIFVMTHLAFSPAYLVKLIASGKAPLN